MEKFSILRVPRYLALLATGLMMALILYSSTQSAPKVEGVNQNLLDHLLDFAHLPAYSGLTFFLSMSFNSTESRSHGFAFGIAVFFGILNEYVQLYVPGRSFSIQDMMTNALGSLIAILILKKHFAAIKT